MVKPEAQKKNLNLKTNFDETVFQADKERIKRVLVNLIANAIKFSPESKSITISAKQFSAGTTNETIKFEIIDEGPGIPEDKIDLVFEKFKQVGTGSEGEKRGSGLGLAICRALVEAHRGKIGVTSKEGKGSIFWFDLPTKQNKV